MSSNGTQKAIVIMISRSRRVRARDRISMHSDGRAHVASGGGACSAAAADRYRSRSHSSIVPFEVIDSICMVCVGHIGGTTNNECARLACKQPTSGLGEERERERGQESIERARRERQDMCVRTRMQRNQSAREKTTKKRREEETRNGRQKQQQRGNETQHSERQQAREEEECGGWMRRESRVGAGVTAHRGTAVGFLTASCWLNGDALSLVCTECPLRPMVPITAMEGRAPPALCAGTGA